MTDTRHDALSGKRGGLALTSLALLALAACLCACNPVYAPLIRAAQYGAPGRLQGGRGEVGTTAAGMGIPNDLVPHVGFGIRDWAALEFGGNYLPGEWATGWIGPRFTWAPHPERPIRLALDGEFGVGGGRGGDLHGNPYPESDDCGSDCDGRQWQDRVAGGGYAGFGIGGHFHWFALYLRGRLEVSKATHIPVTYWPSGGVGMEFDIARIVQLSASGGLLGYRNEADAEMGWFWQFGLNVQFDTVKPKPRIKPDPPRHEPSE